MALVALGIPLLIPRGERTASKQELKSPAPELASASQVSKPRIAKPSPLTTALSTGSILQHAWQGDTNITLIARELLARYLDRHRTNAESLLTAFAVTRDFAYLKSAAAAFPDDPRVQFQVIIQDAFPEQRQEWRDKFRQSMPDNSIVDYLAARDNFKSGNRDQGLADLVNAVAKPDFSDFTRDNLQSLEELYMFSGKSPAEAKGLAFSGVLLPHLLELRRLGKDMAQVQSQYIEAGDAASAERMTEIGMTLGRQLTEGGGCSGVISQMVGFFIQEDLLTQPTPIYSFLGQNPGERLAEIQTQKDAVRSTVRMFDQWLPNASDADLITYFDRVKTFGEPNAIAWLQRQMN